MLGEFAATRASEDSMKAFLTRLRDELKGKVKDAELSEDDFNQAVRVARAHAGGKQKAANAQARAAQAQADAADEEDAADEDDMMDDAMDDGLDDGEGEGEPKAAACKKRQAGEGSQAASMHFLSELQFSESGERARVQIFPAPGHYAHPSYGDLNISQEFLARVKANFDTRIYQQELPLTIDLEHQSALSGAAGWISELELRENGLWATVEMNERGRTLVTADAYRYFSPEYYDKWVDPASNNEYRDVLVGGALTNRPFFKGMAPIAVVVDGALAFAEVQTANDRAVDIERGARDASAGGASASGAAAGSILAAQASAKESGTMGMTEEEVRQFGEVQAQVKALKEQLEGERQAREKAEGDVLALRQAARRKQFSEFVHANRLAFEGEVEASVERLERVANKLSEEEFEDYLAERRTWHNRMQASEAFQQKGKEGAAPPSTAEAEFEAAVRKTMGENPGLSRADAVVRVASEQPALYNRYDRQFKNRAKRAGEE